MGPPLRGEWATFRMRECGNLELLDRSPARPYITLIIQGIGDVQGALEQWYQGESSNMLTRPPAQLLLSLARFTFQKGQIRRLRSRVQLNQLITLPTAAKAFPSAPPPREPNVHGVHGDPPVARKNKLPASRRNSSHRRFGPHWLLPCLYCHGYTDAATAEELTTQPVMMHDDSIAPTLARRENFTQILNNAYVLSYRRIS